MNAPESALNIAEDWLLRFRRQPESCALMLEDQFCNYAELAARARSVAGQLLADDGPLELARVAFRSPPSVDFVAVLLGIWLAGGIAVPLSTFASERELRQSLATAGVRRLVDCGSAASGSIYRGLLDTSDQAWRPVHIDSGLAEDERVSMPAVCAEAGALMLFTSGTTGVPKGVVYNHASLQAQLRQLSEAWEWCSDDCIPLFLPTHHVHGLVNILLCALWNGACVDLFEGLDTERLLQQVSDSKYTLLMAVPTVYTRLVQAMEALPAEQARAAERGFGDLRLMVSGSAALPASQQNDWQRRTGQTLLERYGMTETGMLLANPLHGERRPGMVGQPLPEVELRLVDEQDDVVQGENTQGEIQVRGPGLFQGYWDQPEATAKSFAAGGWFRTGDLAVQEDGYYRILGRLSQDIIKSGGYKLSALEIEQVLLDHRDVLECAVVGLADPTWGEAVGAAVVLQPGSEADEDSLKQWFRQQASHYRTPRHWQFLAELPRNAMGKVSKQVLKRDWPLPRD